MKLIKLFTILLLFLLLADRACAEGSKIYLIQIKFDRGGVAIGEVITKNGQPADQEKNLDANAFRYDIKMVSFEGEILDDRQFKIENIVMGDDNVSLEKMDRYLSLPYFAKAKLLFLFDVNGNLLDQKDIGYLSFFCGDGECQEGENFSSCSKDCSAVSRDGYCNPEQPEADPDCLQSSATKASVRSEKPSSKLVVAKFIIPVLVVISAVAGFAIYKKNRS